MMTTQSNWKTTVRCL